MNVATLLYAVFMTVFSSVLLSLLLIAVEKVARWEKGQVNKQR